MFVNTYHIFITSTRKSHVVSVVVAFLQLGCVENGIFEFVEMCCEPFPLSSFWGQVSSVDTHLSILCPSYNILHSLWAQCNESCPSSLFLFSFFIISPAFSRLVINNWILNLIFPLLFVVSSCCISLKLHLCSCLLILVCSLCALVYGILCMWLCVQISWLLLE